MGVILRAENRDVAIAHALPNMHTHTHTVTNPWTTTGNVTMCMSVSITDNPNMEGFFCVCVCVHVCMCECVCTNACDIGFLHNRWNSLCVIYDWDKYHVFSLKSVINPHPPHYWAHAPLIHHMLKAPLSSLQFVYQALNTAQLTAENVLKEQFTFLRGRVYTVKVIRSGREKRETDTQGSVLPTSSMAYTSTLSHI